MKMLYIMETMYGISDLSSGFGFVAGVLAGGLLAYFVNKIYSKMTRE